MKRRVLGFVMTLALCLNLCPVWVLAVATSYELDEDTTRTSPFVVETPVVYDTCGFTLTASSSDAFQVASTGSLELTGTVASKRGAGVTVASGGVLRITDAGTSVSGTTYALDIAAKADVALSGGTYSGRQYAIRTADGDFAALLAPGCAYFDEDGTPIPPSEAAAAEKVTVGPCTHIYQYTKNPGSPTHTRICPACGAKDTSVKCSFDFDTTGTASCLDQCGHSLAIDVDEDTLVYDGTEQTAQVDITVTLDGTTVLTENKDYQVSYSARTDVGEVTVTVTGITFNGTFTKTYQITQDQPVLTWNTPTAALNYDGNPVEVGDLPGVNINILSSEDLHGLLVYSYRGTNDSSFTNDLPTDAGTYEIKASLPASQNYKAAETNPCLQLTINPINPIATPPAAKTLTYDRTAQELVTAGTLEPVAVRDGVKIEFATAENGDYSTEIPTGTDARTYDVWYRVVGSKNYTAVGPTQLTVTIGPKQITPKIELSESSFVYDGAKKSPKITVQDGNTVIDDDQYTIAWDNDLTSAGTHTATIKNVTGGNYTFTAQAQVEIVEAVQGGLTIIGKPEHVYYGDTVTSLDTIGGTGEGAVEWSITSGGVNSTINQATGVLTVKDTGAITVKAERSVPNYGVVTDSCTIVIEPKPVTAEVTAASKVYDGTTTATVSAAVKSSDLVASGDSFTISGLTGTFHDANVGTNKTVTLDASTMTTTADPQKYTVTCPASTTADITPRSVTVSVTLSDHDLQKDTNGDYFYIFDGTEKTPAVTVSGTDTSGYSAPLAASDYTVSYSNNKNQGTATVTVTNTADGNYTFSPTTVNFTIKEADSTLTGSPQAKDLTYTGAPQELVTVGTAVGGHIEYSLDGTNFSTAIPQKTDAGTYVVYYKVVGDDNHTESGSGSVTVTIKQKEVVSPVITLDSSYNYTYDGTPKTPTVTVKDGSVLIPNTEYRLEYSSNTNAGTATVRVVNTNGGNYIVNGTADFTIAKAAASVTAPVAITGLTYNGTAQALVTAGTSDDGTVLYSLDNSTYSAAIPTGTAVDSYTVYYKVQGDSNHNDSNPDSVPASIAVNTVNSPTVQVTPESVTFNGKVQTPVVTVKDDDGLLIASGEYTVTYKDDNNTAVTNPTNPGVYTLTITGTGTHYSFTAAAQFEILPAGQEPLTITGTREHVYYGDTIQLGTTGGNDNGTVAWSVDNSAIATINGNGLLTIAGVGSVTVTATSSASGYSDKTATWPVFVEKKAIAAVVTAADETYDGNTSVTLTVTFSSGDEVVSGELSGITANGQFADANAGTNKTVMISGLVISSAISAKYDITCPTTTTATIFAKPASITSTNGPTAVAGLTYTGTPQALVSTNGCMVDGGTLAYSLNGIDYSFNLPMATDAGSYTVWYKVVAGENYKDSAAQSVTASIGANTGAPTVVCTPSTFPFDGTDKTPKVTVLDNAGREIPESEYTVTLPAPRSAVGSYTVTVKDNSGGNYEFTSSVTGTFTITAASQNPLTIVTDIPTNVHYGDTFRLSATGGSGSGAISWSVTGSATIDANGVVTVTGKGAFTVTASRQGDGSYDASNTASVSFHADPKPITPVVTADDKPYDGTRTATLHAAWKSGDLVGNDTITLSGVTGQFASSDAGTNKRVLVTPGTAAGDTDNYIITWPDSTTASIYKVDAKIDTHPTALNPTYSGNPQALVSGGSTVDGIGGIEYRLNEEGGYSTSIPTATNAGTYTVWYRVADSINYTGVDPAWLTVTIAKATPTVTATANTITEGQPLSASTLTGTGDGTFAWADDTFKPAAGTYSYDVIFTPNDVTNYNKVTFQVQVTVQPDTSSSGGTSGSGTSGSGTSGSSGGSTGTNSTPVQTTVKNGTASTVVSAAEGTRLVQEAAAKQSETVVIKPEIAGDVTKTEVSIPASTVSQLGSGTDADLTVSAPIADVTIPNAALESLGSAGGTVKVAAEQVDQAVVLTLTAGGQTVTEVPGGVTLAVPVEDAGPGTVAVLVHEDGTRETIRKSLVEDGTLTIPLDGSATVEIVDNSKDFDDVPSTSWAADAVAFASAHELFSGTSETEFSPDAPMSRGMLATVLYSLEGSPEQAPTGEFSDVSADAWYADGIAWAAESGIVTGYGDGQFGPDDSITREQFVVMLWKYAGSPAADSQTLAFTDADQVSGYALEALCWAVEKGILNGYSDGQLVPGGTATRAQAAQMLKNFMENM